MAENRRPRYAATLAALAALLAIVAYVSLTNGVFDLTAGDVVRALLRVRPNPEHDLVLFEFRLPRVVAGALVGLGLSVAGAVVQAVTRNPLADPGILGVSAGAGAAVVVFMYVFEGTWTAPSWSAVMAMPLFGWGGGLAAAALTYAFARKAGVVDPQRLVLAGIAVGSGMGALSLYLSLKMNPRQFEMATVWLTGSIWAANWTFIASAAPWVLLLAPIVWLRSRALDVLRLGEGAATGLGVAAEKEKNRFWLCGVGLIGACVAISGGVAFVGLIAPHLAVRLVGLASRRVIPTAALLGMILVTAADFVARTAFAPAELPVGVVVSLLGVPYFLYLIFRSRL